MKKRTAIFLAVVLCFLTLTGCVTMPRAPDIPTETPSITSYFSASEPTSPAQASVEPSQSAATVVPYASPDAVATAESTAVTESALPVPVPETTGSLVVHVLNVGQGDSIFVQLPNGETMLIDGGESESSSSILSYLEKLNVTQIDYLVATHPHADHIGGLPVIIDTLAIESIYMPRVSHTTQTFERLLSAIENKGMQIDTAKAGVSIIALTELQVEIVAPVRDSYAELNDYSAVIKITYGDTSFLLMGDAEAPSEGQITADVDADVLKVGHHGSSSSTSQAFLNKVTPTYAAISVGAGNSYGHPTDEVLSRLNEAKAKVYRTDLSGTIIFTSDGKVITVNAEPTQYQAPMPESTPDHIETPEEVMVWLSATGSKYHSINNCGNMNPNKASLVTLEYAKQNYGPCSKCNPPS